MAFLEILKRPFNLWFPAHLGTRSRGLGTFSGVYLPSTLQMLGVILFMRLGWITGHIGLLKMMLIIFMASSILFLTGLSMTSIVTNMKVGDGGSYYIISRLLGMAFGSAVGILLTIAQLTTIAICVSGFSISIQSFIPLFPLKLLQIYTLLGLALVSLFPVDFSLKTQGGIFCIVVISILSVFFGKCASIFEMTLPSSSAETVSFWAAFALFFPATTGIESGMAMSGDLKTPSRSLAIGTLSAIITAYIFYVSLSTFLALKVPSSYLKSYPMIMYHLSKIGTFFILGVWGATLSSALGSMMTSPRTLQALAKDGILPCFLAKSPRQGTILIITLATAITLLTDINHLLPILSMVCLITYSLLNFVAFFETLVSNPSWRPLFKTPIALSFLGTAACLASMFMINAGWTFIVLLSVVGLCFWTTKRNLKGNWNDIRYSIFSFFASTATHKLAHIKNNPRSWRPNILAIIDPELKDHGIIDFAHALNQSKGFLTYGTTLLENKDIEFTHASFKEYFEKQGIPCFCHINAHKTSSLGTQNIVQNYGLGPLQPNTIILKPPKEKLQEFCKLICTSYKLQKNIIIFQGEEIERKESIDLWWGGRYHSNFELALALSHLLQSGKMWMKAKITIKTIVKNKTAEMHMTKLFEKYHSVLRFSNLSFQPYFDESPHFYSHIAKYSTKADLTFLGLKAPDFDEYSTYYKQLVSQTAEMKNVAYVLAGEKLNFQGIFE